MSYCLIERKKRKECRSIYLETQDWELLDSLAEKRGYLGPTQVVRDIIQVLRLNKLFDEWLSRDSEDL